MTFARTTAWSTGLGYMREGARRCGTYLACLQRVGASSEALYVHTCEDFNTFSSPEDMEAIHCQYNSEHVSNKADLVCLPIPHLDKTIVVSCRALLGTKKKRRKRNQTHCSSNSPQLATAAPARMGPWD